MIETYLSPCGGFSVRGHEVGAGSASFTYTAGVCSDCGAPCASQMVEMDMANRACHARCSECYGRASRRKADASDPSWFAAEERATR